MKKGGYSVTVACDASSIKEWFDPTLPLKVFPIPSDLAMKFRKQHLKGFINAGSNNIYIGTFIGNMMFGVLGFSNPDYGDYDLLMKADTTPSEWHKSTDLLLFILRTKEVQNILEKKFCRKISNVYSLCFSKNNSISRYRKHGKKINEKIIRENIKNDNKTLRDKARNTVNNYMKAGKINKPNICESCGKQKTIEAHHSDYNQPLKINWLCIKCHDIADGKDKTTYSILGYNIGYLFQLGSIPTVKEAKAQFIQKSWKN